MVNCGKAKLREARLVSQKIIENDFKELDKLGEQSKNQSEVRTMRDDKTSNY